MTAGATRGVDRLLDAAGVDPAEGVQVVAVGRLAAIAFDPSLPLVLLAGAIDAPSESLPGRHARSGPHAVLASLYPADHQLLALLNRSAHRLGDLDDATLAAGSWLVPALDPV